MSKVLTTNTPKHVPTKTPKRLVVQLADGSALPLVLDVATYKRLVGDERTTRALRFDLLKGAIPTLDRPPGTRKWQISTVAVLRRMGVPFTITGA